MRMRYVVAVALVAAGSTAAAQSGSLTVDGRANLFGAGGNGGGTPGGGVLAPSFTFASGTGLTLRMTSVTGSWGCCTAGGGLNGADGRGGTTDIGSHLMISGIRAPSQMFLAGVFLDAGLPGSAPARLNFNTIGTSFATLAPTLGQMFWIGDGLTGTGSGSTQEFMVPTGATRLFLGVADAFGFAGPGPSHYDDNVGALTAAFAIERPDVVPEPATVTLLALGLTALAVAGRRRSAA